MEMKDMKENISNVTDAIKNAPENIKNLTDKAREIPGQVRDNVQQISQNIRSRRLERKIPDAFEGAPKFISPAIHRWLDVGVAGYFAVLGTVFAAQGKKGAATAAFVNAGMVAGVSYFTDYEGTYDKPISFHTHGTMDALQAMTAAAAPVLHGFADEPEAWFFYGQALNEVGVIAFTDWNAGERDQAVLMEKENVA